MTSVETFLVHPRMDACAVPAAARERSASIAISVNHDLPSLETDWRAFEQTADCTVFQTFDWLDAWQRNIGMRARTVPVIVSGRDVSGRLLFIIPLAVRPTRFGRELRFLGGSLCDYNAPLLAPDFPAVAWTQFRELWDDIRTRLQGDARTRHDLIVLDKMPESVGKQRNPLLQLATALNPSGAYAMHLGRDWESFYAHKRSSATRRRDRTKRKRLGESGDVRLVNAGSNVERRATLETLMRQKSRAFARMGVPNIFDPAGHREFYFDAASRSGFHAHVSTLMVGDTAAATNLGLVYKGCYYHVLASYDDGPLSRFGPGVVHLHELMGYAIERGCTLFDFTIGDEPYKREWSDQELKLYDHVAAASARGALVAFVTAAARKAKRRIKQSRLLFAIVTRGRATLARMRGKSPPASPSKRVTDEE